MADGRFDNELLINHHGCLTPGGPLNIPEDETVVRLNAWIWQDSSACMVELHDVKDGKRWEITTDPEDDHEGPAFKTGAAAAMGILVSKKTTTGEYKTYQWADAIFLYKDEKLLKEVRAAAQYEAKLTS
jgi:hypothetical protein